MATDPEWRPIETAPKFDQVYIPILVFCPDAYCWKTLGESRIRIAWWEPDVATWHDGSDPRGMLHQPSHWMPLPEPPAGVGREEVLHGDA